MESVVVIVGAGPAGLAVSACLFMLSIPFLILEKDNCIGSLWKKRAYDRLRLHLAKQFCELPYMAFPREMPTFIPKDDFIRYLDNYTLHFGINPIYHMNVESATYDEQEQKWEIKATNVVTNETNHYCARFIVVASGENSMGYIPNLPGMSSFNGEVLHSSDFKSGRGYTGKSVLVIGSGNSGMEIAHDLATHGAMTTISVRSPVHIVNKELIYLGMTLLKYLPMKIVDRIIVFLAWLKFGDLSNYGIVRPNMGPFMQKAVTGLSPTIDVGAVENIKAGQIQVQPAISNIVGSEVTFSNGQAVHYETIIFATGYRSTASAWFKDGGYMLSSDGLPAQRIPHHWKGNNGAYCAGLSKQGLHGISVDARNIATDISQILLARNM
ncbi:putative indole-3-pyruvate monooxygenase YUCCA10 [Carex littledalei]|uniref:Flavin-containing monooxygenase n=1 Tax=Carex littledalei TaxID=544730 RepID=A0A833R363_9POAL|nr:putative indole-3-pyruvate monooxygenase YUCCA10 [Carex littledalei]